MLRDNASLLDIYNAGNKIKEYSEGMTIESLSADDMRMSAILYSFIIIGEATKRLSSEFKENHSELPWSDMAGMRDVLAH